MKKWLSAAAVVVALGIGTLYYYFFSAMSVDGTTQYVYIDDDDNIDSVLTKVSAVSNAHAMSAYTLLAKHSAYAEHVRTGRYAINGSNGALVSFRHMKNGTIYSIIGYLKIEKGDAEEALRFNKEALEYDDADPVFLDNLGQTYYRLLGDKQAARPYFDRALAIKPKAIDTNYFLALYDIDEGDLSKARERLNIAKEGFFSPLNYATPELIDKKLAEINA